MRFARVATDDGAHWAQLTPEGDAVLLAGAPWDHATPTGSRLLATSGFRLLAPATPSKIVAIGSNYPKHAAEMGKPAPAVPRLFLKAPSAIVGPNVAIEIPPGTARVDPEGELALIIGRRLTRATATEAEAAVFGFTALNDVTCRDFQRADGLFARAKGFDTFCPMGPWIETDGVAADRALSTVVNGETRAHGNTRDMTFNVGTLLSFISGVMTLLPGDVVTTGTPPGVAPIHDGDVVEVHIEGLGVLRSPVVNRADRSL